MVYQGLYNCIYSIIIRCIYIVLISDLPFLLNENMFGVRIKENMILCNRKVILNDISYIMISNFGVFPLIFFFKHFIPILSVFVVTMNHEIYIEQRGQL